MTDLTGFIFHSSDKGIQVEDKKTGEILYEGYHAREFVENLKKSQEQAELTALRQRVEALEAALRDAANELHSAFLALTDANMKPLRLIDDAKFAHEAFEKATAALKEATNAD